MGRYGEGSGEACTLRWQRAGFRALIVPHGAGRLSYGTDLVAPPGNQAANGEHKQVPTVQREGSGEARKPKPRRGKGGREMDA